MLGRAAMLNPSIFRSLESDSLPRLEVSRKYLRYAKSSGNLFYISCQCGNLQAKLKIVASKSMCTLFEIFALDFAELELNDSIQNFNPLACTNEPSMFMIGRNMEFRVRFIFIQILSCSEKV